MRKLTTFAMVLMLALSLMITLSACDDDDDNDGAKKSVTVGNKNFTEEYVVGQLIKQLLEDRGFDVNLQSDLSTSLLRGGMETDDIDICAEYTGTAWMTHLGKEYQPGIDNNELYNMVKDAEVANGFIWLDPMWNNNTYALASWPEFAEENNLVTMSDLAAFYNAEDGKIKTFVGLEYSARPDGLPALEEYYGFNVSEGSMITAMAGASLIGLENDECEVAMVFGTDAAIAKNGWHVYSDDLSFFPPYDLTACVRAETLEKYPEIEGILNELAASFPGGGSAATPEIVMEGQKVWQALNAQVDIDYIEPDEVAREYLLAKGLISE